MPSTFIKLNDDIIKISASCEGLKNSNWGAKKHQHHRITVVHNDHSIFFDFWASQAHPYVRTAVDLLGAFNCFISEAMSGYMDFEEFCDEFGYEQWDDDCERENKESKKIHNSCVKMRDKFVALKFVSDIYDIYDMGNELREKYDF